MADPAPDRAPNVEVLPMTELTGPEELVGPSGRIKVNTSDVPAYLAQGYRHIDAPEPVDPPVDPPTDPEE